MGCPDGTDMQNAEHGVVTANDQYSAEAMASVNVANAPVPTSNNEANERGVMEVDEKVNEFISSSVQAVQVPNHKRKADDDSASHADNNGAHQTKKTKICTFGYIML
jgi:hypothetical protein